MYSSWHQLHSHGVERRPPRSALKMSLSGFVHANDVPSSCSLSCLCLPGHALCTCNSRGHLLLCNCSFGRAPHVEYMGKQRHCVQHQRHVCPRFLRDLAVSVRMPMAPSGLSSVILSTCLSLVRIQCSAACPFVGMFSLPLMYIIHGMPAGNIARTSCKCMNETKAVPCSAIRRSVLLQSCTCWCSRALSVFCIVGPSWGRP